MWYADETGGVGYLGDDAGGGGGGGVPGRGAGPEVPAGGREVAGTRGRRAAEQEPVVRAGHAQSRAGRKEPGQLLAGPPPEVGRHRRGAGQPDPGGPPHGDPHRSRIRREVGGAGGERETGQGPPAWDGQDDAG